MTSGDSAYHILNAATSSNALSIDPTTNAINTSGNFTTGGSLTVNGSLGAGISTWTPTIGDGTNNFSTSTASGQYTKLGNMVWFTLDIIWTSKGSAVAGSNLNVSLPLAISSSWHRASFTMSFVQGLTWTASTGFVVTTASAGNSNTQFYEILASGSGPTQLLVSNTSTAGEMQISGFYSV